MYLSTFDDLDYFCCKGGEGRGREEREEEGRGGGEERRVG